MIRLFANCLFATCIAAIIAFCLAGPVPALRAQGDNPKQETPQKKKADRKKEEVLRVSGALTSKDPTLPGRGGYFRVYEHKMVVGRSYLIEMTDPAQTGMDPFVRVEDSTGKLLAEDDDSGGNQNARLVFTPVKDETFRIVATTFGATRTGNYVLTVLPVAPGAAVAVPGRPVVVQIPVNVGDLTITPNNPWGHNPQFGGNNSETHGYIEYRFVIDNNSETKGHTVRLTLPRSRGGFRYGRYLDALRKTVEVGPGGTAQVSLFQPDLPLLSGNELQVEIDGRVHDEHFPLSLVTQRGGRYNPFMSGGTIRTDTNVLVPSQVFQGELTSFIWKSAVGVPLRSPPSGGGSSTSRIYDGPGPHKGKSVTYWDVHRFTQAVVGVEGWSRHWLGYSSFDGVALPGPALDSAPREVQAALWQYVECGGTLLVLGAAKLPESWERDRHESGKFTAYSPGFGQCLVTASITSVWDPDDWRLVTGMWERSRDAWNQIATPTDANREFPIVEGLSIPVRGMFVTMMVFVLLIGPLNLYWLSRARRRIWLLWTVPAVSLVTCILLVGYMTATEGWHGHVRAEGVTVLDESAQRAATIGWYGCYSPMTSGGGLRFSFDTELTPHLRLGRGGGYSMTRHPHGIDWTNEQNLFEGWTVAKVPSHFMMRRGEKRLERVTVRKNDDGSLALVNGLGADISAIHVASRQGLISTASDVRAGAEAILQPTKEQAIDKRSKRAETFAGSWSRLVDAMAHKPSEYLRPGSYLAVIEDSPFLEQGLRNVQTRKMRSVVYGIMKEEK